MEEEKWIQLAKELAAACSANASAISVETATNLLASVQEMERAAHVVLLQAVMQSPTLNSNNINNQNTQNEWVKPPAVIPVDDLVQVLIHLPEVDPQGDCVRRRVEALDLGQSAWGKLQLRNHDSSRGWYPPESVPILTKALQKYRACFVEMDLTDAPLTAETMGVFAERVLHNNTTLRALKLNRSTLGGDGIAFLAGALRNHAACPLTSLSLNAVHMDDASFRRLCKVLAQEGSVPCLSELQMADNPVTSLQPLSELVKSKVTLNVLCLARLRSLKDVEGLGAALAASSITHLDCSGTETNGWSQELAVAVQANKILKLQCQADTFSESDYDTLGAAVGISTTIRTLQVGLGNVTDMPSRKGFFSGLGRNTSLEELHLSQSRLDDKSSMELANAVAKHPTLQNVSAVRCNRMAGPCAQQWASAIVNSTTLCELRLDTNWNDDALLLILEALPNSSSLQTFELSGGPAKLLQAVKARMEGDDAKAEDLIEQFCSSNAQKKELKKEYDEQVAKQESLRIRDYVTGDRVMVYQATDSTPPVAGCVIDKTADHWYNISRDDGEPRMRCTLKQIRPRIGHDLPVGSIVNAPAYGGREYRAKIVHALPDAKYKVVPFWTVGSENEAKEFHRHQLTAVLP